MKNNDTVEISDKVKLNSIIINQKSTNSQKAYFTELFLLFIEVG